MYFFSSVLEMQHDAHRYCVVRDYNLPSINYIGNELANSGNAPNAPAAGAWDTPNNPYNFEIDVPPFSVGARAAVYLRSFCLGPTVFALPVRRNLTTQTSVLEQASANDVPGILMRIDNPHIGAATWNRTVLNSYSMTNLEDTVQNSILIPYTQIRYDGYDSEFTGGAIGVQAVKTTTHKRDREMFTFVGEMLVGTVVGTPAVSKFSGSLALPRQVVIPPAPTPTLTTYQSIYPFISMNPYFGLGVPIPRDRGGTFSMVLEFRWVESAADMPGPQSTVLTQAVQYGSFASGLPFHAP